MRVAQPEGSKGSLKWIQKSISSGNDAWLPEKIRGLTWVSPLPGDDWAEYRDASFLSRVQQDSLIQELSHFWPSRGPQWDALGLLSGVPVLVEAKAHLREFFTPPTQASTNSRERIERAFMEVAPAFGSERPDLWSKLYFQYANRLAHLWFFHHHNVRAHLLFVSYLDDEEMNGPTSADVWRAAFDAADYTLGLKSNRLSSGYVHHVMPSVTTLT